MSSQHITLKSRKRVNKFSLEIRAGRGHRRAVWKYPPNTAPFAARRRRWPASDPRGTHVEFRLRRVKGSTDNITRPRSICLHAASPASVKRLRDNNNNVSYPSGIPSFPGNTTFKRIKFLSQYNPQGEN